MSVCVKVIALVGARGIHVGIAATQFATSPDVAVMRAVITHATQINCSVGPCGAAVGEVKTVSLGLNAGCEISHVIIRQEGLHREIIESGIHIIVLVADVIVAITAHRAATGGNAQVTGNPLAAFLVDLATHLHGRKLHVIQPQHLIQSTGIA